jgi:hypothetical protein
MADIYNKSRKNERLYVVLLYWSSWRQLVKQDEVDPTWSVYWESSSGRGGATAIPVKAISKATVMDRMRDAGYN